MDQKFKILAVCAGSAFLAGPLIWLMLEGPDAVKALAAAVIIALLAAAGIFAIATFLRAKDKKIRIALYTTVVLTALFAIFCLTIINLAPKMMFYPRFSEESYTELSGITTSPAPEWLETQSGIRGWRIPAKNVPSGTKRPVILFWGGNGMESSSFLAKHLLKEEAIYGNVTANCDFIFFDYPTYGKSEGDLTASGIKKMALDAFDYASSMKDTKSVICMGYSIGTGLASYAASERADQASGLILLAPYENSYDLYNNEINIFHGPLKLLVTYNFDSGSYAKKVTCPVTIFASPEDEVIPYISSRRLFADFTSSSVNFVSADGLKHNDFMDNTNVWTQVGDIAGGIAK